MSDIPLRLKKSDQLTPEDLKRLHRLMVEGRVLEETLISMYRRGDGYFWIGGPGEESFQVPLGLQVKVGQGLDHDWLHLHYRSSAVYLAMGGNTLDPLRQMRNDATDPFSGGRNFGNHLAVKEMNLVPIHSTIGTQYAQAPGTAWIQKRHGGDGLTIVNGGDAGAAEGEFESCLIWSSRPGRELPMLILLMNNEYGISTERRTQWAMNDIIRRAEPYGMPWKVVDGNDVFASWDAIHEAMDYIRRERKPYALQANVSRLHGHSSASGAERVEERDNIPEFEQVLIDRKVAGREELEQVWKEARDRLRKEADQARAEPRPEGHTIYDYTYAEG